MTIQLTKRFESTRHQTSANASTWYRYSSNLCVFVNYLCMNLYKITLNYSIFASLEYLYFGRIWWILVEVKRISSNYSCFSPFMVHSRIIIWLWRIKRIRRINIRLVTRKWPNIIQFLAWMLFNIRFEIEYFDLESSLFCFVYYST